MNLLSPWSLLWLAPLAAAIIFLYLLKLRRVPQVVASVMLWNQIIADLQANAPFQKLRRSLLLFLQLLALLVIIAALARPFVKAPGFEGQSVVVIFDASASMRATDVAPSRFGQAKKIARKTIDDLGRGDTMAIIAASSKTRVVSPFTTDRGALGAAVEALECTDSVTQIADALRLADSLCARKKRAQILVLSDGAFAPLEMSLGSGAQVRFVRLGERADNVAITALGARRPLSGQTDFALFVAMQNFSEEARIFTVELYLEEELINAREETLAPKAQGAEIFDLPPATNGLIEVRLDVSDDLANDNRAFTFVSARRQRDVLLLTRGNLFLERALNLDPALVVSKAAAPPPTRNIWDLVVVDRLQIDKLPPAHGYLFIDAGGELSPVAPTGEIEHPAIIDWRRADPVTRYIDFSGVRIAKARRGNLRPWAKALAETATTPLIAAGEREGSRRVYVGWDLLQSDFPLRVGFPIFIANCVDWLAAPVLGAGESQAVKAGEVVRFSVPAEVERLRVGRPGGESREVDASRAFVLIEDTETVGLYKLEGEDWARRFAVNMLEAAESDIAPRDQMVLGGGGVEASGGLVRSNKEYWRWLVIAALCVLTLEWIVFHKRP